MSDSIQHSGPIDPPENRFSFTDAKLRRIEPPPSGRVEYYDEEQPGLILRVSAPREGTTGPGRKTFYLYKWSKVHGPIRRKLDSLGTLSVAEARKRVRELAVEIERGNNPNQEEARKRRDRLETLGDLWDHYRRDRHPHCRPSTVRNDVSMWERHVCGRAKKSLKPDAEPVELPAGLSKLPARGFTATDAKRLHTRLTEEIGATIADEVIGLLGRLYRFAGIEANPCKKDKRGAGGIRMNGKTKIVRYLTQETFQALVGAMDADSDQEVADLMRMALFTGQRRDNVRTMRWDEIDLHVKVWRIPAAKFKSSREAETPLPSMAVDVLKRRLKVQKASGKPSAFVFPSREDASHARVMMDRQVRRVFKRAGLEDWRFHDLRHACASAILLAGGTLAQAGRQLNHASHASTERYAHLHAETVAQASDRGFAALATKRGTSNE